MKFIKTRYQYGDVKIVQRFAWFPIVLDDNNLRKDTIIWLEKYYTVEERTSYRWDILQYIQNPEDIQREYRMRIVSMPVDIRFK